MTREDLVSAASALSTAAGVATAEDTAATLRDLADQLEQLADRERPPDHGRLARIQRHCADAKPGCPPAAQDAIETADDHINAFRETIEGV